MLRGSYLRAILLFDGLSHLQFQKNTMKFVCAYVAGHRYERKIRQAWLEALHAVPPDSDVWVLYHEDDCIGFSGESPVLWYFIVSNQASVGMDPMIIDRDESEVAVPLTTYLTD